jgi:NAD-dependent deacetylase
MIDTTVLRKTAQALRSARHVVVLTGAGVSAESGIPTFRDALTGLWDRFDAEALATAEAFRHDPALVWGWYEWRRGKVLRAQPNPGHLAIAELETMVPQFTLVTQNVDDLHERAGSAAPIHLHGSLHEPRCFACARPHRLEGGMPDEPEGGRLLEPPRCLHCGGRVRPGVVWFGETLPMDAWKRAKEAASVCDVMIVVGTSGLVQPAASLPGVAAKNGAWIVLIDPNPDAISWPSVERIVGAAGVVLPALVAGMRRMPS